MKPILVVDDEQDVRTYLTRLFEENGYAVVCAVNGAEALEKALAEKPALVTLDLSMPETSGVRFYRDIKTRPELSGIPVVMVTGVTGPGGNARDTERFYSTRKGVPPPEGFVAKPIDREEMLALVERLIGKAGL
jgi:CheY-like chemotaxis protein